MESEIYCEALRFRQAIEQTDKARLTTDFRDFPKGSCGDASLLLAKYLKDCGFGEFDYMLGFLFPESESHSHAWLQQGDLIVDITIDQFDDCSEPVFVSYCSPWHDDRNGKRKHVADCSIFGSQTELSLENAYSEICKFLE